MPKVDYLSLDEYELDPKIKGKKSKKKPVSKPTKFEKDFGA